MLMQDPNGPGTIAQTEPTEAPRGEVSMAAEDERSSSWNPGLADETGESARINSRVVAVCNAIGEFIEYWGFKRIQGRVWTYLALSAEPRSQQDLAKGLNVSKALMSSTVAELERLGLVGPVDDRR